MSPRESTITWLTVKLKSWQAFIRMADQTRSCWFLTAVYICHMYMFALLFLKTFMPKTSADKIIISLICCMVQHNDAMALQSVQCQVYDHNLMCPDIRTSVCTVYSTQHYGDHHLRVDVHFHNTICFVGSTSISNCPTWNVSYCMWKGITWLRGSETCRGSRRLWCSHAHYSDIQMTAGLRSEVSPL